MWPPALPSRARSWPGRPTRTPAPDVVIIGGGIIGCASAYALTLAGLTVTLIERDRLGAGASGVAAGMIAPQAEAHSADAIFALSLLGAAEYPALTAGLLEEIGLDIEYRRCGVLRLARDEAERADLERRRRWQTARGLPADWYEPGELATIEPLLAGVTGRLLAGGLWLPNEGQVRGPRLIQALALASLKRGLTLVEGTPVLGFERQGSQVTGLQTPAGLIPTATVLLAAGVASGGLAAGLGMTLPVGPVKGQIITARGWNRRPRSILWATGCYLAPKADGELLLGATEEDGASEARPTVAGLNALTTALLETIPSLGQLAVEGIWAGLRPAVPDRLPVIGYAPGIDNLIVATAHYRHGILLGPLTGKWIANLIQTGTPAPELAVTDPARLLEDDHAD